MKLDASEIIVQTKQKSDQTYEKESLNHIRDEYEILISYLADEISSDRECAIQTSKLIVFDRQLHWEEHKKEYMKEELAYLISETGSRASAATTTLNCEVCFVAGTPILMANNLTKPIEKIVVGDKVWARPHDNPTGPLQKCKVTKVFHNAPQATWKLVFENQRTKETLEIEATEEHPFYVLGLGWTTLKDMKKGDKCISADKSTLILTLKTSSTNPQLVYNFEVENCHTYFVGNNSALCVIAHNFCVACDGLGHIIFPGGTLNGGGTRLVVRMECPDCDGKAASYEERVEWIKKTTTNVKYSEFHNLMRFKKFDTAQKDKDNIKVLIYLDKNTHYVHKLRNEDEIYYLRVVSQTNTSEQFSKWFSGELNGIIIYTEGPMTEAISKHEALQDLENSLAIQLYYKTQKNHKELSQAEIISITNSLGCETHDRNPMLFAGTRGEANWKSHSVRGKGATVRKLSDGAVGIDGLVIQSEETLDEESHAKLLRAALGSFRYTCEIESIDYKKGEVTVWFKAYNVFSNKSLYFDKGIDAPSTRPRLKLCNVKELDA